jgi:hypothetical protein
MDARAWAWITVAVLALEGCAAEEKVRSEDEEQASGASAPDEIRAVWRDFNAAASNNEWAKVRDLVTTKSRVLLDAMTEAAGHPPPDSLLAVDKVYAAAFEPAPDASGAGEPTPEGEISIQGERATMQFAGEPPTLVHFVREEERWKLDLAGTLVVE